jgi:hypothetical protein
VAIPSSSGAFHMTAVVTSLPLCKHTGGGGTTPAFSGRLVYLQFLWGSAPLPLSGAWGALPSLLHVFLFIYFSSCLFITQFGFFSFFFLLGWGSVCPGGYADLAQGCLWEYHVPLSSPGGLRLPKQSGHWHLVAAWEPFWFLHLMWSGDAMHGLGVWRSQSFASSQWFFL